MAKNQIFDFEFNFNSVELDEADFKTFSASQSYTVYYKGFLVESGKSNSEKESRTTARSVVKAIVNGDYKDAVQQRVNNLCASLR